MLILHYFFFCFRRWQLSFNLFAPTLPKSKQKANKRMPPSHRFVGMRKALPKHHKLYLNLPYTHEDLIGSPENPRFTNLSLCKIINKL